VLVFMPLPDGEVLAPDHVLVVPKRPGRDICWILSRTSCAT
jgi:hypothetical protein